MNIYISLQHWFGWQQNLVSTKVVNNRIQNEIWKYICQTLFANHFVVYYAKLITQAAPCARHSQIKAAVTVRLCAKLKPQSKWDPWDNNETNFEFVLNREEITTLVSWLNLIPYSPFPGITPRWFNKSAE